MSLEPIKIPQNVYIEDRIVGPITLRHIIILGVGGGISYVLYGMANNVYAQSGGAAPLPITIICWIPALIAAAFAFVKINDLSLLRIMLLTLEKANKPTVRQFAPRQSFSIHIRTFNTVQEAKKIDPTQKNRDYQRIDDLTNILDSPLRRQMLGSAPVPEDGEQQLMVRDLSSPAQETLDEEPVSSLSRLPVNRDRIQASPLPDSESRPSVSIFRDIVAK